MSPAPPSRPAGLTLRAATPADAEAVARLLNILAPEVSGAPGIMTAEIARRDILSGALSLRAELAELQGFDAPVGLAVHGPAYETAYAARGRYLQDLVVAPEARRQGVAEALIARLARLTRDEGGGFLWWINPDDMPSGRGLYQRVADIEERSSSFALTREAFQRLADTDR